MGGGVTVKKVLNLLIGGTTLILLFIATPLFAQIEDELLMQEPETSCEPESLSTVYDQLDLSNVALDDIRQWYSFGSEYYKNKNYKSALPYLWKVFIADSTKYGRNAIRKIADSYFQLQRADSTLIACYRGLAKYPDHVILHYFKNFVADQVCRLLIILSYWILFPTQPTSLIEH